MNGVCKLNNQKDLRHWPNESGDLMADKSGDEMTSN
jgi:hypothetical protein